MSTIPLFPLGQIVATPNALDHVKRSEIEESIFRHVTGDWGDLCDEDKEINNEAVKGGCRILSAYHTDERLKFWIITEADRSVTTILLPEDY